MECDRHFHCRMNAREPGKSTYVSYCFPKGLCNDRTNKEYSMQGSPHYKCPIRAMPQTARHKYNEHIIIPSPSHYPVAAERDIYIIPKPGRQGYMPSFPEFRYRSRHIGKIKILHEVISHDSKFTSAFKSPEDFCTAFAGMAALNWNCR